MRLVSIPLVAVARVVEQVDTYRPGSVFACPDKTSPLASQQGETRSMGRPGGKMRTITGLSLLKACLLPALGRRLRTFVAHLAAESRQACHTMIPTRSPQGALRAWLGPAADLCTRPGRLRRTTRGGPLVDGPTALQG